MTKFERYIKKYLNKNFPQLKFSINDNSLVDGEIIHIYIPEIKLAFEFTDFCHKFWPNNKREWISKLDGYLAVIYHAKDQQNKYDYRKARKFGKEVGAWINYTIKNK